MAAPRKRKKTTAKKSSRRPARKAGRKSAPRTRAKTTRKAAKKTTRKKAARKAPARRRTGRKKAKSTARKATTAEGLARKLVRATSQNIELRISDIYAPDATSLEPTDSEPTVGIAGLQGKLEFWNSIQDRQRWKAHKVFVKGNTICIEWEADVHLKDGRDIKLKEIAIHEVRGGKIIAERYYYDPAAMAPPDAPAAPSDPELEESNVPDEVPPNEPPDGSPPLDPLDV